MRLIATGLVGWRSELQFQCDLLDQRTQRRIEGVPDKVIDALIGKIGQTEMRREQRREQSVDDACHRLPRRQRGGLLMFVSRLRSGARDAQLGDDPVKLPIRARNPGATVFLISRFHRPLHQLSKRPSNRAVLRYRSPESGSTTTIVLPAFCGRLAIRAATATAAPLEMPEIIPSSRARRSA